MSSTPLSDSREVIDRSIFHAIRKELVDKGYLPDVLSLQQNNITVVNQLLKQFTIVGNYTVYFAIGRTFSVISSTGNNGSYLITASAFSGGNTIITVQQAIPSSTADGKCSIYTYYDDAAGVVLLKAAFATIKTTKGFAIEVFGVGAQRAKYQKRIPRIVIVSNQSLPGALGGAPDKIYTPVGNDPLHPDSYTAKVMPPQTKDFSYDIRLVSSTAEQMRILHNIIALATPVRGYVPLYNDSSKKVFVVQYSYRSIPDPEDNIFEDIYMYRAEDIFEQVDSTVGTVKPITQITIDINEGTPPDSDPNTPDDYTHLNDIVIT